MFSIGLTFSCKLEADFHLNGMHWYVFNIADSSVTIGLIFLLYSSILMNK